MIQFYHTSSGTYNDSSIVTPQESLVFDTFNQRIRLMETYDLYFMRLTADYSHDTSDSSKFALSQHGAYELYDYVNTLDTSVCNAIDTANSSITSLKTLANNLNSSINAVNTSINSYLTTLTNKDTSINASINAVNTSVNTYLTTLTNKDTSINSSLNAVNTSVNTKLTSLMNSDTSLNSSINAVNTSVNTKFVTVDSSMLQIWQMYYEMQVVQAAAWNQLRALNPSLNMPNASVYQ
jgi:chromosome segregation ATPase